MSVTTSVSYIDISNNDSGSIQARANAKFITIPASVVEIADNSFENSIVESIIFMGDSQLKTIGKAAFKNCKFLNSIQIPPSVVEIADEAFFSSTLEEIVFTHDSQLKTIGKGVFRDCKFLASITIPDSVTHIESNSFRNSVVEEILFGENSQCAIIDQRAFENCYFIKPIKMPSSVLKIEDSAFCNSNIQTIIFADDSRLETIGKLAFDSCKSFKSIEIPSSVVVIGCSAFSRSAIKEVLFSDDSKLEILDKYIFERCISLKSITIPASILEIGEFAFSESGIEEVIFSDHSNLKTIGNSVFRDCKFLKSITIPDSVTDIGVGSFMNARIKEFLFGANSQCTTVGRSAFQKCRFLKSIEIPSSVLKIGNSAFYNSSIQTIIFTNDSRLEAIASQTFYNCQSLQSIKIPSSIVEIDRSAFKQSYLTEVIFAEKSALETIHSEAFFGCRFLKSIEIPDSVVTIAEKTFSGCNQLQKVMFSVNSKLEAIGKEAFFKCHSLQSFPFPQSLREIGSFAFTLCELPKSITLLSPSVELLGDPFTKSGVDEIIFGNSGKTQTSAKNNHFLQLCKEGDLNKCKEYVEQNDINLSYTKGGFYYSNQIFSFIEDAVSIAIAAENVDLIKFLITNKVLMYSQCKVSGIEKCFSDDDIFERVFFESPTLFWYSICSLVMKKADKLIRRLLNMLKSKEYLEEWLNIFKSSHQITPLQCVTQGNSLDFYHFLIDYDLIKLVGLEARTIGRYYQLASQLGYVEILKKSLEIFPMENISFKFTDFLMCAPQDKLYSMIEYTLPYILETEDPFRLVVEGKYVHHKFFQFPETVLSYLAYAQAFDAFKYVIENVSHTEYTPSHLVACSLFRGYSDAKKIHNVDRTNFMKLFDYILQDDIRPHVLGEDKEWVGKSIFTCIKYGSSEMCMKLFSYGFDKDDIYIDVISDEEHSSIVRYSLLSYACRYQSLEVVQFLIDIGVTVDGLLPNHTNSRDDSNKDDQNIIDIEMEDDSDNYTDHGDIGDHIGNDDNDSYDSGSYDDGSDVGDSDVGGNDDSYDNDNDNDDNDNDDDDNDDNGTYDYGSGNDGDNDNFARHNDVTNPENFAFANIYLEENAWFEPYFNPYRLNKNQDVETYLKNSRPFDPSTEDPLTRFMELCPSGDLTLLNFTPLAVAIHTEDLNLVKLLLKNGANPNAITLSGFPHLFVLGARSDYIDLDHLYTRKAPFVEYPDIHLSNKLQGKKIGEKMKDKSGYKDVSITQNPLDQKFTIFQELVDHGADLFHDQEVYYTTAFLFSNRFNIYTLCTHLNYPLNFLKYLQTIPQLCDKIKEHYINSFRTTILYADSEGPSFSVDTVDYMFENGYLHIETFKEDEKFKFVVTSYCRVSLKQVLEKYGFDFPNFTDE